MCYLSELKIWGNNRKGQEAIHSRSSIATAIEHEVLLQMYCNGAAASDPGDGPLQPNDRV